MASVNGQRFVPACHQGFAIGSSMIHLTPSDLTQIDWFVGFCIWLSDVGCRYMDDYRQRSNQESALCLPPDLIRTVMILSDYEIIISGA